MELEALKLEDDTKRDSDDGSSEGDRVGSEGRGQDSEHFANRPLVSGGGSHDLAARDAARAASKRKTIGLLIVLLVVLFIVLMVTVANRDRSDKNGQSSTPQPATQAQIQQCLATNRAKYNPKFPGKGRSVSVPSLPNTSSENGNVLIQNATILNGLGAKFTETDILVVGGRISQVGQGLSPVPNTRVINVQGKFVTPGIVDMHSHMGVYAFPEIWATSDGNEMTNPTFPQVRAIDAFDPEDWAIPQIMAGGVTTAQVLPGSGNIMGGEGGIFKLRGKRVGDMFVEQSPRLLKMACGENPKRVYGRGKHVTPMSRMGSAWLMRDKFDAARTLNEMQEEWCRNPSGRFPHDLSLESLAALQRGDARLHCHCYQIQDLEMVIRLSKEFNFKISAFHHALEAYKVPDIIKENNITIATFSDLWGYKFEAYDASVRSPKILNEANVPVALKSDHPVLFAKTMMYEAAKAHYYGLDDMAAISAVTSIPAAAIGMDSYVGSIQPERDGDIVVWDRDPLTLGAKTDMVLINGVVMREANLPAKPNAPKHDDPKDSVLSLNNVQCLKAPQVLTQYAIVGVTVHTVVNGDLPPSTIIVDNGNITCLSPGCNIPDGYAVFNLTGGHVMPGLVDAGSGVGQVEIDAESSTQDGSLPGADTGGSNSMVHARDGIRIQSRHVRAAWSAGVTTSIAHPMGSQVIGGLSVAFHTCHSTGCPPRIDDANMMVQDSVALHVSVGNQAKQGVLGSSISGQFEALYEAFEEAEKVKTSNISTVKRSLRPFVQVLNDQIPLVAETHQSDVIASMLRLQAAYGFAHLVILGGAEAHVLASELASAGASVLLESRVPPMDDFDKLRARDNSIVTLTQAGVKTGLFVADPDNGRNLRWEAGWAVANGLGYQDALKAVTTNVGEMFKVGPKLPGILIREKANLVAFDGDPLTLRGRPQVVAVGTSVHCKPEQF